MYITFEHHVEWLERDVSSCGDGSFFARTDRPDGELGEYRVAYTFGVEPLQQ